VNFAVFSPDGKRIFTGADDGTAQVWSVPSCDAVGPRIRHGTIVKAGEFSPDGRRVATVSREGTARIWDAEKSKAVTPLMHHDNTVVTVAFSPDGCWLATAGFDKTVRLWDAATGMSSGYRMTHAETIRSLHFSPDSLRLVSASEDGTARIWDIRTGRETEEAIRHQGAVWSARFDGDGQRVVTASSDRTVQIWDVRPGTALPRHLRGDNMARGVYWSPDGRWVVVGFWSPVVFDAVTGESVGAVMRHPQRATQVSFSPDGSQALTLSSFARAKLWDLGRGEVIAYLPLGGPGLGACFSHDGAHVLVGSEDRTATVWTIAPVRKLLTLEHPAPVRQVVFSPDGRKFLTAAGGVVKLWSWPTGRIERQWVAHPQDVIAAKFNSGGDRVLTVDREGVARIWETREGVGIDRPLRHGGAVVQASFSPDGTRVVTASDDKSARVWDADSGLPWGEAMRHEGKVAAARFSSDGLRLLTASADNTVRVWDLATGQPLISPWIHADDVTDAVFSPDGSQVLTASTDRSGRVYDVVRFSGAAPEELIRLAEAVGGLRIKGDRTIENVSASEMLELKQDCEFTPPNDPAGAWVRWFLEDRTRRAAGPSIRLTVEQYAEGERAKARRGDPLVSMALPELRRLFPRDGLFCAQMARVALKDHLSTSEPRFLREADWLSRRAMALAPDDPVTGWVRADWLAQAGQLEDALDLMRQAGQKAPTPGSFWLEFGEWLEAAGRPEEAFVAYTAALDGKAREPALSSPERRRVLLARARLHRAEGRMERASADRLAAFEIEVPLRSPDTPLECVDLSAFYNANLSCDWQGTCFPRHNLSVLPRGVVETGGVVFDIRGAIQFAYSSLTTEVLQFPEVVPDIPVGRRCQWVHFLQACALTGEIRPNVTGHVMHLENGDSFRLTSAYGVNIAGWDCFGTSESGGVPAAWEGTSPAGLPVQLYVTTWTNPVPDVVVSSIDLESASGALVVAITVR
jgi:WD40 repeat protein/tetratricopeptide (TPR) repeat protein